MSTRWLSIASILLWCMAAGCGGYGYDGARREQNVQQRLIPDQKGLVRGHGTSIRLPDGWTGVIYKRRGGLPVLHAASFTSCRPSMVTTARRALFHGCMPTTFSW